MRCGGWGLLLAALAGLPGCSTVHSSVVPARGAPFPRVDADAVRVTALDVPPQAAALGLVQVHGRSATIETLIAQFVGEVARLGGDLAKIDTIDTRFEEHEETSQSTYECGTRDAPQTCTTLSTSTVEVPTTRLLGRAFRRPGRRP